jgi:hypothetical protein
MRPCPKIPAEHARAAAINLVFPRIESSYRAAVRKPDPRDIAGCETMNNNEEQ